MPSSRPNGRRRIERRQVRSARRARRFALLVLLAAIFLVALFLTAFGGAKSPPPAPLAQSNLASAVQTRPVPEVAALRGPVRLQLPIAQPSLTAIGFHSAGDGALSLSPVGHQLNEGLLQRIVHDVFGGGGGAPGWYELGGGTSALDVGARAGTDVYSPVDGTIAAIRPFVVEGKRYGSEIDIAPQAAPLLLVTVTQLAADPALTVGSAVVSGATQLGRVVDLAAIERQALARYTNDAGNHVTVEVRPAPAVSSG